MSRLGSSARQLGARYGAAADRGKVRQALELAAAAPLRRPVELVPEDGLGLFDHARSPSLF